MIHAQGMPVWLAVLDVDTGDVLGVPTTHVIGKLEYADPAPKEWSEAEGPMESFGFEDWPGVGVVYADRFNTDNWSLLCEARQPRVRPPYGRARATTA